MNILLAFLILFAGLIILLLIVQKMMQADRDHNREANQAWGIVFFLGYLIISGTAYFLLR